MTEKRYSRMTNHYGTSRTYCTGVYDNQNNRELKNASQVITELNALHEENVKLQARNKYLATKIQRERNSHIKQHEKWEKEIKDENEELKQFKEKVFVLLDEKIKHYEHKPFSASVGQPMSVNFDADVDRIARLSELQDLKKELQE